MGRSESLREQDRTLTGIVLAVVDPSKVPPVSI